MSCTTFGNRRTNGLRDDTDERNHRQMSKFRMEHRCQYPRRKNAEKHQRRSSLVGPPSKIFFFLLLIVSHLVATTTLVVSATSVVGEQNGDATVKEDEENGVLNGEEKRKVLFSSHDLNEEEEEEIVVDSIINDAKEDTSSDEQTSKITEETDGDASNNKSDPSSNENEASEETTMVQKTDALEVEDDIDTLTREEGIEETPGSSSPSLSQETTRSKAEEVKGENDKEESIDKPLDESIDEDTENNILSSSEKEIEEDEDEVQKDTAMDDETATATAAQEVKEEEKDIPSVTSSSSSENSELLESESVKIKKDLGDDVKTHEPNLETAEKSYATSSSSSSEKTTKARPEVIEKKKDIDGGPSEPLTETDSQNGNEPSDVPTKHAKDKNIQKKTTMENVEKVEETLNEITETETQDEEGTSSFSKKNQQSAPLHDNANANDNSYIDSNADSEGSETEAAEEKEDDGNDLQSVTIKDENTEDIISGVNNKARARARARADRDRRSTEPAKTVVSEDPVAATTDGATTDSYRGQPWGQYRSNRRLPDLELLQLVFENTNKTRGKRATGDRKSQKVVNDWKKDPLYDENIAMDEVSQEPLLVDEDDQQFLNYRSQLLGQNGGAASVNPSSESQTSNDKTSEDTDDNAFDNSESVEGLDFFEGVDPPDELDVGHGSSIQDVLMDKGKHILLKKVRGVARWIRARWQTMRRKLEERISEFQSPFHKIEGATITAPDFDAEAVDSSESNVSNAQRDRIVAGMRESLVSVWKAGKQTVEVVSDLVDGLLDRFDGRSEDDSTNFEDFDEFDLDDLSTFPPPQ